jgi:hypothetical protein
VGDTESRVDGSMDGSTGRRADGTVVGDSRRRDEAVAELEAPFGPAGVRPEVDTAGGSSGSKASYSVVGRGSWAERLEAGGPRDSAGPGAGVSSVPGSYPRVAGGAVVGSRPHSQRQLRQLPPLLQPPSLTVVEPFCLAEKVLLRSFLFFILLIFDFVPSVLPR